MEDLKNMTVSYSVTDDTIGISGGSWSTGTGDSGNIYYVDEPYDWYRNTWYPYYVYSYPS